jgi:hypothetical protein
MRDTVRRDAVAAVRAARRAWSAPGRERDLVVQAGKAALAACVAWAVAGWWLKAPLAFVAPWVAVVLVESTVYRSIAHGLQQLLAIAVGTVVATAAALALGNTMAAMAVVLPVALLLGNWHRLGDQGIYAATATLFTLTNGEITLHAAGFRVLEAVFGAAVGIAVNALILPPVYLRDSRAALHDVVRETEEILDAVADGLAADLRDEGHAGTWHKRALRLSRLVEQARTAIGWSRESLRGNPRRRAPGAVPGEPGQAYQDAVEVLDRVAVHTAGLTRTVLEAADGRVDNPLPRQEVTGLYADFLRQTATAIRLYGVTRLGDDTGDTGDGPAARRELHRAVDQVRRTHDELRHRLPRTAPGEPEALAMYGSLLLQARRLTDQLLREP